MMMLSSFYSGLSIMNTTIPMATIDKFKEYFMSGEYVKHFLVETIYTMNLESSTSIKFSMKL